MYLLGSLSIFFSTALTHFGKTAVVLKTVYKYFCIALVLHFVSIFVHVLYYSKNIISLGPGPSKKSWEILSLYLK